MDIREKLEIIICNTMDIESRKIDDGERLIEDISIDSIRIVKIIVGIENEFGFEFDDEYLNYEKIYTFGLLFDYVKLKMDKKENKIC